MRLFAFGALLVFVGVAVFLVLHFTPVWREARDRKREERRRAQAFERSKELLTLITYDPLVAEQVLEGLKRWKATEPARRAGA